MQANQASKAADENEEVPKTRSVPKSKEQSRKKLATRPKGKRRRKIEKVALSKKAMKRSKFKEANDDDSKGNFAGAQMTTAEKLDDIMDILDSSKNQKQPESPVNVIRKIVPSVKSQPAVLAALNELQNTGESPDADPAKTAAVLYYSRQILAHLKENPHEMSASIHQLKVILHIPSNSVKY